MASSAEYAKFNSAVDNIISIVGTSHLGEPVDESFLIDLKSLIENKMIDAGVIKPAKVPVTSVPNTELERFPLPNEILVKIFGYLNILDISRCAQICHQLNMISKDSSLWESWGKLSIESMKVPTEFLTYIIQRGITELSLIECEILPPKIKLAELKRPLNLKTLSLDWMKGDKTLLNEILTSHSLEKVDLRENRMSENYTSQFIEVLPQIGSQLKSLNLDVTTHPLYNISLIVDSCLDLEELNIRGKLSKDAMSYLCENLTSKILKLDLSCPRILNDNNIRVLVKRCPKLTVLDIRSNEKVTYQGLVAIIEGLHFVEYLGVPDSIGNELGLPNMAALGLPENIDLIKMGRLKSMKNLKVLFIGGPRRNKKCQSILKREIPQLREYTGDPYDFAVGVTDTEDFRSVEFCPNCHECDKYLVLKC